MDFFDVNFLDYVVWYCDIVVCFGCFLYWNDFIGWELMEEEIEFLKLFGSGFWWWLDELKIDFVICKFGIDDFWNCYMIFCCFFGCCVDCFWFSDGCFGVEFLICSGDCYVVDGCGCGVWVKFGWGCM